MYFNLFIVFAIFHLKNVLSDQVEIKSFDSLPLLTTNNFNQTLDENDIVLVFFYEKECEHFCVEIEQNLLKLRNDLSSIPHFNSKKVGFGKLLFMEEKEIFNTYPISNSPSLFLFNQKLDTFYDIPISDVHSYEHIVKQINSKYNITWNAISVKEHYEHNLQLNKHTIILCSHKDEESGKNNFLVELLSNFFNFFKNINLAWVENNEMKKLACQDPSAHFVLHNTDGDKASYSGNIIPDLIKDWIEGMVNPLIIEMNEETMNSIYETRKDALIYLYDDINMENPKNNANLTSTFTPFLSVAKKYKNKLFFVEGNTNDDYVKQAFSIFQITPNELPFVGALKVGKKDLQKYKFYPNTTITEDSLSRFIQDMQRENLEQHFTSSPAPDIDYDEEFNVYTVVSKTFKNHILNDQVNDTIMFFSSDDDEKYPLEKNVTEMFISISQKCKNYKGLKFVNFNFAENELPSNDIDIQNMGFYLFPAGNNKSLNVVEMKGDYSAKLLLDFISNNSVNYRNRTIDIGLTEEDYYKIEEGEKEQHDKEAQHEDSGNRKRTKEDDDGEEDNDANENAVNVSKTGPDSQEDIHEDDPDYEGGADDIGGLGGSDDPMGPNGGTIKSEL